MDLELTGKVFVITGGSAGLGYALAEELVHEGARVALLARESRRLASAADSLRKHGGEVLDLSGDVTCVEDLRRLVEAVIERWGVIDGVVNNAGQHAAGPFADQDDDAWEGDFSLKLMAAVRLSRLALPALRESRGAIVNVLATSAKAPEALTSPTAVTRAAGLALTKLLSRELAADGVRVNAILNGVLESAQLERRAAAAGVDPETYYQRMVTDWRIPLGRVGHAREFADLAAFLLSSRASYVTGAAVNLDGGLCPVA
jgi:NAD(P)-dependent dehydrogenase (short-subunit alcohol dehydrogenase family)